jgi:hypothetical protein
MKPRTAWESTSCSAVQHFKEPEVSLPCTQEPATCRYSQPGNFSYLLSSYYPSTYICAFVVVSFLLASPSKAQIYSSSPHACYMPASSHPLWLAHTNYVWRGVQITRLHVLYFSPASYCFITLRSIHYTQHPCLKYLIEASVYDTQCLTRHSHRLPDTADLYLLFTYSSLICVAKYNRYWR